jgi:hypothetical protein
MTDPQREPLERLYNSPLWQALLDAEREAGGCDDCDGPCDCVRSERCKREV